MMRLAAVVVPLVLLVSACGQDTEPRAVEPDTTAPAASSTGSSQESGGQAEAESESEGEGDGTSEGDASAVPALLDFAGVTVQGDAFDGSSLAGRPTVLWFWAPWCPTCRGQIPQVKALASEHGGDLNVIGIGSLDSAEAIADFAGDVAGVTHLEDVDGDLWKRFGVTEQSSFVVLDADGTVAFEAGYGGTDDLDAEVESLLG